MPLTVTDVEPHDVGEEGGYLLRVAGTFVQGVAYEVRIGTVAGDYCLSGKPGLMRTVYPLTAQEIRCYSPVLTRGDHAIVVRRADGSESATLAAALTAHARQFTTSQHAVRKVLPPFYRAGARSIRQEPLTPGDSGWIQAMTDSVSDEDGRLGGLRQTRLTAAVASEANLNHPYEWDGTAVVLAGDTSEVSAGDWIRLVAGGRAYEVLSVVAGVSASLDLRGETPPTGPASVALTGTVTWDGSAEVVMTSSQVCIGMWIRQSATGFWFQIYDMVGGSVRILNPHGVTIPTGSGGFRCVEPRTAKVTVALAVESTLGWEDAGQLALDGVLYSYASRSLEPPELRGVSRDENGVETYGLRQAHAAMSVVTDLTRASSGVDLARRSILVDYAEGEWLNALGRNLGVLRYPFLESDDVFREIIKALAYCPRGTMYCLELALDAMVGAGNYELWEDLVNYPCTVFIRLLSGAVTSADSSVGKTYLTGVEHRLSTTTLQVSVAGTVVTRGAVHGVRLRPEDRLSDFRNQLPSADTQVEYDGGPASAVWVYSGLTEAWVTQVPGECIVITHPATGNASNYARTARVTAEAYASLQTIVRFDSAGSFSSSSSWFNQVVGRIYDGDFIVQWGTVDVDAGHVMIALSHPTFFGVQVVLDKDVYYDVELRKYGEDHVDLLVDGALRDRQPYSAFSSATSSYGFTFGVRVTGRSGEMASFKQAGFYARSHDDYWSMRGAATTNAANPTRVSAAASTFVAGDVGKQIVVRGATLPTGVGRANGTYVVSSYVSSSAVEVVGKTVAGTGELTSGASCLFEVPRDGPQLMFPDDLGKTVVVTGSDQGNDGSYVITDLLDPDTGASMSAWLTWLRTETCIAVVTPPGAVVTESGLTWRVDPVFVTDTGMEYELSAAGTAVGSVLTLRQALPYSPIVVDVTYSQVLSALVLLNFLVQNEIVQTLPAVLWAYYPFYITDPFGFLRSYLDDLTAAGVIPELVIL